MPKPKPDLPRLLTTRDAAKMLSVSPGTLLKMGNDGTLPPPLRMGRNLVRWRLRDLRRFIGRGADE
jgi:predicted DNA-binding transcriptional regulator AlpA